MKLRNPTDTFRSTHQALAKRILNSPLSQFIEFPERLQNAANGEGEVGWSFLSAEFRRAGTNCSISFKVEQDNRWHSQDTDEAGNEWTQWDLSSDINYPCHGSTEPGIAMARLAFYQEVALFTATLQAEFGSRKILQMTRTAEQVEHDRVEQEIKRVRTKVYAFVEEHRKGMKPGSDKDLTVDGIPPGEYYVNTQLGEYRLLVTEEYPNIGNLSRVKKVAA
jgi:hypothetical protein